VTQRADSQVSKFLLLSSQIFDAFDLIRPLLVCNELHRQARCELVLAASIRGGRKAANRR